MKVVYAGSFSPPTFGHLDIIRRASALFDEVVVAVLSQSAKTYLFSPEARKSMLERITSDLPNVQVMCDTGLLVDVVHRLNADAIIRGLRNTEDLNFEMQMAEANRHIGGAETIFLACRPEYSMISSTIVRDCALHGAPLDAMVPGELHEQIYDAFGVQPNAGRMD